MKTRLLSLFILLLPAMAFAQLVGDTENGLASYYSAEYNGAETAYNVIYDKNQLVAAHRQFPFNSSVLVKNMENGKSVTVRIIDEGPFIRSRIIELSERAAASIGLLGKESVPVELTLLSVPGQRATISVTEPAAKNDPVVPAAPITQPDSSPRSFNQHRTCARAQNRRTWRLPSHSRKRLRNLRFPAAARRLKHRRFPTNPK